MKVFSLEDLQVKALNLLSFRPRSVSEMKFRLKRLGGETGLIDRLIEILAADGLLNDEEFARWWVDQRIRFRPKGNIALKSELMQKGVDKEIIVGVLLSPEQEKMLAKDLVNQRGWQDRETITKRLLSRGFSFESVAGIIDEMAQKE
ncbi:MAG TPA: RecX family transcriptional regulator [Patescibacteria group bacterium]|nr:RecX family transcriptional regulator [Patescibacteria group bacterium]